MKSILHIEGGNLVWRNAAGELHRDPKDGPAFTVADGAKAYYVKGQYHRDPKDGPAVIWADGAKWYYVKGQRVYPEEPK